jgi:integrase
MTTTVWDELGVSRATYFRHKKHGTMDKLLLIGDEVHVGAWVSWRDRGVGVRKWSENYRANQRLYISKYFEVHRRVSSAALGEWLATVDPIQHSKRRDMHQAVCGLAKYLVNIGKVDDLELTRIKKLYPTPPPEYTPEQYVITEDDLSWLIRRASGAHVKKQADLNVALLTFYSETGLRVSEGAGLTIDRMRFSRNPREAVLWVKGKGGKTRVVPFSRAAQECVRTYRRTLPEDLRGSDRVFWAWNPKHGHSPLTKDGVARRFHGLAGLADIKFSCHSLRHYRITQWANDPRIPIAVTQKWAGHSSLVVTQRYIHIADDDAMQAAYG